jgi:hypothetical protein
VPPFQRVRFNFSNLAKVQVFQQGFLGASLEQAKEGSELVSATEATTWI